MSRYKLSDSDNKKLTAAYGADPERRIATFGQKDTRNFHEMLQDQMLAAGITDNAAFLKHAGLSGHITTEQWQGLLSGALVPGKKLAGTLYATLKDNEASTLPSYRVFLHRAETQRSSALHRGAQEQVFELPQEAVCAIRLPMLAALHEKIVARTMLQEKPDEGTKEFHGRSHPILRQLSAQLDLPKEEVLMHMRDVYRRSPEVALDALAANFADLPMNEIAQWLEQSVKPLAAQPAHIGEMIRLARMTQGDFIHSHDGTVFPRSNHGTSNSRWELGLNAPRAIEIERLKSAYALDANERQLFKEAIDPAFIERWLEALPAGQRLLPYIRRISAERGLTPHEVEKKAGIRRGYFYAALISSNREAPDYNAILEAIAPNAEECARIARYEQEEAMEALVSVKQAQQSIREICVDPQRYWDEHGVMKRCQIGELLILAQKAASIPNKALADALHYACDTSITFWRSGNNNMTPQGLHTLANMCEASDPRHEWFDRERFVTAGWEAQAAYKSTARKTGRQTSSHHDKDEARQFFDDPVAYHHSYATPSAGNVGEMLGKCLKASALSNTAVEKIIQGSKQKLNRILGGTAELPRSSADSLSEHFAASDPGKQWFDKETFMGIYSAASEKRPFVSAKTQLGATTPLQPKHSGINASATPDGHAR